MKQILPIKNFIQEYIAALEEYVKVYDDENYRIKIAELKDRLRQMK